jgi:hypothetical protein
MNAFGLLTDSADTVCRIIGWLEADLPGLSGQKKGATLSDHPIAIARSCNEYRPLGHENQALF